MTEPIMHPSILEPELNFWESDPAECAAFQASMAERIGAGEDLQTHPHMETCERCRSLVHELEAIAEAARQLMPIDTEPDEDLWSRIEVRLAMQESEPEDREASISSKEQATISLDGGLALEGGIA